MCWVHRVGCIPFISISSHANSFLYFYNSCINNFFCSAVRLGLMFKHFSRFDFNETAHSKWSCFHMFNNYIIFLTFFSQISNGGNMEWITDRTINNIFLCFILKLLCFSKWEKRWGKIRFKCKFVPPGTTRIHMRFCWGIKVQVLGGLSIWDHHRSRPTSDICICNG